MIVNWKEKLSKIITDSGYSDREISAWTNISPSVISNMKNKKLKTFHVEQFIKLALLFKKDYKEFITELYGGEAFDNIDEIDDNKNLSELGNILKNKYQYEVITRKSLSKATGLSPVRINYIVWKEDQSIKIDEIIKIEIALGIPITTLIKSRFKNIKINNKTKYLKRLKQLRTD